jgi:hypothetical protein
VACPVVKIRIFVYVIAQTLYKIRIFHALLARRSRPLLSGLTTGVHLLPSSVIKVSQGSLRFDLGFERSNLEEVGCRDDYYKKLTAT